MTASLEGAPAPEPKFATLVEALAAAARDDVDDAGLIFVDLRELEERLSFGAIQSRAAHIATALLARGVRPGDRVALVLPTAPSFMDAFFGALLAGAVAVPLYPPVRLGRLDEYHAATSRMLQAADAAIVVTDERIHRLLGVAVGRARPRLGCVSIEALAREPHRTTPLPSCVGDDLAIIQFSSGSTVDPKPVALSHANVLAQCAALSTVFPTRARDGSPLRPAGVSWLPLYHDMGLIGALLSAVYLPARLALIPPEQFLARPALWLRAIARHRAAISPAPNFAYAYAAKRVRDEDIVGIDLSCWQLALNGAEPVSPAVLARFVARFSRHGFHADALAPVYGLAEASLAVTFPRRAARTRAIDAHALAREGVARDGADPMVSVGAPIAGVSLRIVDDHDRAVDDGVVGRILVRGPSVMTGYFGLPDETARTIRDGWLDTGDLGFVDGGELFVCGRVKDVIVVRGANHPPQVFEEALDGLEGVRAGCVVAVGFARPGGDGEQLVMLVERPGEIDPAIAARVVAVVVERTGIKPDVVQVLSPGTLPRTSSGKLRRREALRRFAAGTLDSPSPVDALRVAAHVIRSTVGHAIARLHRRVHDLGEN